MPVGAELEAERDLGTEANRRHHSPAAGEAVVVAAAAAAAAAVEVEVEALGRREACAGPASSRQPLLELLLGRQEA